MTKRKSIRQETMSIMDRQEIICALEDEGFSLLKRSEPNPEDIMISTLMQDEPRLLLGIPLLLNNHPDIDLDQLYKMAESRGILPQFGYLLEISARVIKKHNPKNQLPKRILNFLKLIEKPKKPITFNRHYSDIASKLRKPEDSLMLKWNIYLATPFSEFDRYFVIYSRMQKEKLRYEKLASDLSLREGKALRLLFTDTQIEIINKKIIGEELTKTEREYYSRIIKKRLMAIGHIANESYVLEVV